MSMTWQRLMNHLRRRERESQAAYQHWSEQQKALQKEIARGIVPQFINLGAEMTAFDIADYFTDSLFQKARLERAQKEEFVVAQRILECREELMAIRQAQRQLERFQARQEAVAERRRQRLWNDEMVSLSMTRQQIGREAVKTGGCARIPSIRLSRGTPRTGSAHSGYSVRETGDLS